MAELSEQFDAHDGYWSEHTQDEATRIAGGMDGVSEVAPLALLSASHPAVLGSVRLEHDGTTVVLSFEEVLDGRIIRCAIGVVSGAKHDVEFWLGTEGLDYFEYTTRTVDGEFFDSDD